MLPKEGVLDMYAGVSANVFAALRRGDIHKNKYEVLLSLSEDPLINVCGYELCTHAHKSN